MARPQVEVRQHDVTCRTYAGGSMTDARLRQAMGEPFAERLGAAVESAGLGDGYWLVRRLDLRAQVGADWEPTRVGAAVAGRMVSRLAGILDASGDGENILWFPDRETFLSRYLLDLADGRAASRWEYAQFDSGDIATALVALADHEPDEVLCALTMLEPRERQRVLSGLSPTQEAELTDQLAGASTPGLPARESVLAAVHELRAAGLFRGQGVGLALAIAAMTGASLQELVDVVGPAREVADLQSLLDRIGARVDTVLDSVAAGDWRRVLDVAGAGASDLVLPFVSWSEPERRSLRDALLGTTSPDDEEPEQRHTPYGGMFLLLPLVDELCDWDAATHEWPPFDDVAPARVARMLVVAAALGREQTREAVHDPLLRLALGVPETLDGHRLGEWVASVPDTETLIGRYATALLHEFGLRLPGMAAASPAYLLDNLLDLEAWVRFGPEHEATVELGHPPLHVLLTLAGMDRSSFRCAGSEMTWTLTSRG